VLSSKLQIDIIINTELFGQSLSIRSSTTQCHFRKLGELIISAVIKQHISIWHF